MTSGDLPPLTEEQKRWAFGAAGLFILAVGFLGFSLNSGVMQVFAVGWLVLMIFGFVGAGRVAKGDFAHPLFKAQVLLHVVAVGLLVAVMIRAFK